MEVFLDQKLVQMELVTQHLVMPRDLNYHGNLFGGTMLAWIDEGVAMFVMNRIRYTNIVTVSIQDVIFKSPGKSGDIIQIYAKVESVGKSSITLRTTCIGRNQQEHRISEIIDCKITYVCLNDQGKPRPYFLEIPELMESLAPKPEPNQ